MKIRNKTHWLTTDLKRILQRAAEMELEPAKRKQVVVTVKYTRKRYNGSSGSAYYGGNYTTIRIPKGSMQPDKLFVEHCTRQDAKNGTEHLQEYLGKACFDEEKAMDAIKLDFAAVARHEFAHLRGMRHRQMSKQYLRSGGAEQYLPVKWVLELPLTVTVKKKKIVDVVQRNYEKVMEREAEWVSKLKRAQRKVREYAGKRRRYEQAFAQKRGRTCG